MKNRYRISFLTLSLAVALLMAGIVWAQTGGNYDLTWWTVDGGGGTLSGGGYALGGTIGQPEPGPVLTGGDFALYSGFWAVGGAAPSPCPAPLLGVEIVGPSSGYTGSQYSFTAQSNPVTPTLPLTFTWSTDGLLSGQGTATAVYSWVLTGSHAISLTAANYGGSFSDDHTITLAEQPASCAAPLTGVSVSGPAQGDQDADQTFTANIQPTNATTPITYVWSVAGLVSGQGTQQAVYRWSQAGSYLVNLSASNCGGSDNDDRTIEIGAMYIYLPLVLRNHN